jgi:hypothetical protein
MSAIIDLIIDLIVWCALLSLAWPLWFDDDRPEPRVWIVPLEMLMIPDTRKPD